MSNDDKNTSDLRQLLKGKLTNNEAAPDGWNVPSGGVWAGISDELSANSATIVDKRKPIWPWLVIGLLACAMLFRECSHHRTVGLMKQEMIKLQQDCEEKQGIRNQKQSEQSNEMLSMATSEAPVAFTVKNESAGNGVEINQSISDNTAKTRMAASQVFEVFEKETIPEPPAGSSPEPKIETIPVATSIHQPRQLPYLSTAFFTNPLSQPELRLQTPIIPKTSRPLGLIATAYAGLALTGNRTVGEKPGIISEYKPLLAWRTGVGVEATINRHWSVLTGLDYNTSRFETDYSLAVPFTHDGEFQHDDGNYDNQYNHSLPSAMGDYPLQMVLTRASNATIHEGDVMNIELRVRQKTQFLSLPLQLRYTLGKNKWQMGFRAGAVANHTLFVESEKPDLKPLHEAIHQRHTSIGAPKLDDLSKWTFDYAVGLDCRYSLTNRIGVFASTAYQRAITPIYDGESVDNYLQSLQLNTGFFVQF